MFQYVLCAGNTALGIYPSMTDALESVLRDGGNILRESATYAEAILRDTLATIVACKVCESPSPLFN